MTGLQRANLVLVLLFAQAVQVLLLVAVGVRVLHPFGPLMIKDGDHRVMGGRAPRRSAVRAVPAREQRTGPGVRLPGGVLGALLHRLRRDRRALPQGVLHGDHERAAPGRGRARRLPGSPARAATGARIRSRWPGGPPDLHNRAGDASPSTVRRSLVRSGRPSHQGCQMEARALDATTVGASSPGAGLERAGSKARTM